MAPPGAGKTVMACKIIADCKVSTLILVHRQPLLEQWKERISSFLKIPIFETKTLVLRANEIIYTFQATFFKKSTNCSTC